ncbi:deoxynucleotidyltransferase terminal-interacting protein 1 isoform X2 [Coccinella septempunctata]|uniref:deoxynucleotidyltransferase terminal-interacting protein 1 isoform X2 n=1 Tax=Coccinella septempunctata TaxID=41139 RepID=UPI001D082AAD|nr:deoxynucleotidyltransferase terminal-interacting protein 1 isoform X2 [Coccinella septempunctata]XP_044755185.1 deoxynucleotidyltransferase terminal-interacting protein 1 isoform X2 [Coccinella septempunctata]
MIPPVSSNQVQFIGLENMSNPFDMKQVTLVNLGASTFGTKNGNKSNLAYYRKTYSVTCPTKSLELLRKNLQKAINRDIESVVQKYVEKFFQPAIINIKNNLGKDSINEEHIKDVCRNILEEAKDIYKSNTSRDSSPYECSDSETSTLEGRMERNSPFGNKRKESDTDSENNKSFKKVKNRSNQDYILHKLPVKREAPKWDSERILQNTLFIMGAKANKVLGYGQTRGRLYVRHPELVRYSGDQEDKEWLSSKNLMPPSGGKAYLMILSDIKELTESDDYKNSPNLQLNELKGFEVPQFLLNKIKIFMESVRTDRRTHAGMDFLDFRSHSLTPPSLILDSPSTPSDVLGDSHSGSMNSKQSDFVHIPETSPSSNHSIISGTAMNQSPLATQGSLMSPNILLSVSSTEGCSEPQIVMLKNPSTNGNALTNILAQHFGSDTAEGF